MGLALVRIRSSIAASTRLYGILKYASRRRQLMAISFHLLKKKLVTQNVAKHLSPSYLRNELIIEEDRRIRQCSIFFSLIKTFAICRIYIQRAIDAAVPTLILVPCMIMDRVDGGKYNVSLIHPAVSFRPLHS